MLSVRQYQEALEQISPKRRSILLKLYLNGPFLDSNLIADVLEYQNFNAANLHIGNIGKFISEITGVPSKEEHKYKGEIRLSYYQFVHRYTDDGWDLWPNLQKAIEERNWPSELLDESKESWLTEEKVVTRTLIKEGKLIQVLVNRYERDKNSIYKAEKLLGRICVGCNIDFQKMYGHDIKSIIHYHHTRPLHKVKKEEEKDIAKELVPLCPNCHSVVHSTEELMSITDLRKRVKRNKQG